MQPWNWVVSQLNLSCTTLLKDINSETSLRQTHIVPLRSNPIRIILDFFFLQAQVSLVNGITVRAKNIS